MYTLKRLLSLIPVFCVVSLAVFLIVHITPGDTAAAILGMEATQADIDAFNARMGYDRPIAVQYCAWVFNLLHGDMGYSFFMRQSVAGAIFEHLGPTLVLSFFAQTIAILLSIPSGIIAAKKRGTAVDDILRWTSLIGMALPSFLLGLLLMLFFGVLLVILPVAGYESGKGIAVYLRYMILPALTLGIIQSALLMRMTRAAVLDVLSMDYIKTARAKGFSEYAVLFKHALQNALLPILTAAGNSFGSLITGAVIVETLFNIPGLGMLIINSIFRRDFPVIQGVILFVTLLYAAVNFIVDVLYGFFDPRLIAGEK